MTAAWFSGLAAETAQVDCDGELHTVRWHDGAFRIPAHTDPDRERALAALGAEMCACVKLFDAWHRHVDDPQVLILGPRAREPLGAARRNRAASSGTQPFASARFQPPTPATDDPLPALLGLDGMIPRRFVATVAAALLERAGEPNIAADLYGALYGRLLADLLSWRPSAVELDLAITDAAPTLKETAEGGLRARLALVWLTEVWGRDLDLVADELTLSARPLNAGRFELLTVDRTLCPRTRVVPLG